jgi:hypothetical protein
MSSADQARSTSRDDLNSSPNNNVESIVSTPVGRLNLSRSRIRQSMQDNLKMQNANRQGSASRLGAHWLDSIKSMPGGTLLIQAIEMWWLKQPLRAVTKAAIDTAKGMLQPLAQKHPLALIVGAFAVGGVIAWSRPWRWVSKPIVFSSLLAPLLSKVISSMPSGIWAEAFNSLLRQSQDQSANPP